MSRLGRVLVDVGSRAFVALFALVVGLALIEFVGRHTALRGMLVYYVHDVDHRPHPHADGMNGDGIWCRHEAGDFRAGDRNVIFLGDSFVLGRRAGERFTIPAIFESLATARHPERPVHALNFGWVSASPLLELHQLRAIGAKYHPSLVVMCVDMTDLQDDVKYEKLIDRPGVYALVPVVPVSLMMFRKALTLLPWRHGPHEWIFGFPPRRFFASDEPLQRTAPYFATLRHSVDATRAYCADTLHARFVLCILPRSYQYSDRECPNSWERGEYVALGPWASEPFRYFDHMRTEVDYPVHSLLPDFRAPHVFPTCFDDDPHWNASGNRLAAFAIERDLEADGLIP